MAARTPLTPIKLAPGQFGADAAEALTAVDATNGMVVQSSSVVRHVLLRVTNTAGAPHTVTVVSPQAKGNPAAIYGATPGPAGSNPVEPDLTTTSVPASTGVRYIAVGARYFQVDNTVLLNFDAGFTGFITALEVA